MGSITIISVCKMNSTLRQSITQFNFQIQHELLPLLESDFRERLSPAHMRVMRTLELVEVERFVPSTRGFPGRPQRDRLALARALVAKAVLGLSQTCDLIERLRVDKTLRRLCGFDLRDRRGLNESLFSRAFAEFSAMGLPTRVHEALIHNYMGDALVGHLSRDSTAIEVRERPKAQAKSEEKPDEKPQSPRKRGRPRKDEVRPIEPKSLLERQAHGMSLDAMLAELPCHCDVSAKSSSQGAPMWWRGYKLHLDVADGMIPVSAIVTAASVHDSQVALPLSEMSYQRVTSLYDLMDSAYDSQIIRANSYALGHVPLIDPNPTHGASFDFTPPEKVRFRERSTVERANARLKDEFGLRRVNVRGAAKVTAHLMFAVLALSADQLLRWVT